MRSAKHQRIFSVVLGFGLLITGSFFALPLMVAAYILGLMLIGFGVEPRMAEEPAEIMPVAAESRQVAAEPPMMSAAPKPKARKAKPKARKKPAKRRRKK